MNKNALGYDPIIRDVPGFEDTYQISENGEVYNKKTGRELKLCIDRDGYLFFGACKNGTCKSLYVHRILAIIFINNPNNHAIVDHINRDRTDNQLSNLRWVNTSMNMTNRSIQSNNTSGYANIGYKVNNGLSYWRVRISKNKEIYMKYFEFSDEGLQEAIKWRDDMKTILHTYN